MKKNQIQFDRIENLFKNYLLGMIFKILTKV